MAEINCNKYDCKNNTEGLCTTDIITIYHGIYGVEWCFAECISFKKEIMN